MSMNYWNALVDDLLADRPTPDEDEAIIIEARIEHTVGQSHVWVRCEGNDAETVVVTYYRDELTFLASEFVGLTVREAKDLHRTRDTEYLRS